jgi:hypothetical protein
MKAKPEIKKQLMLRRIVLKTYRCNLCGKDYPIDPRRDYHFSCTHQFCYPSQNDGDRFDLDVCPKCEDLFASKIVAMCVVSPISANLYDY